ncbi:MAG: hypothetical protein AAGG09_00040 [Pseudomonadota bacterium]
MSDTVIQNLTPLQRNFLEKYVLKTGKLVIHKEKKNAELTKLLEIYQRARAVIGKKISGLHEKDTMRGTYIRKVEQTDEIIKGKGKTKDNIAKATLELQKITLDLNKHIEQEEKNAAKFSIDGQVQFFVSKGLGKIYDIAEEFRGEVDKAVEDMRKVLDQTDLEIPEPKLALKMERAVSSAVGTLNPLVAAARAGDTTLEEAKSIIGDAVQNIEQTATDLRKELTDFVGDRKKIETHIENVKLAEAIRLDLDSMSGQLTMLQNWEVPNAGALVKRAQELRQAAEPENPDLAGLKKSVDDFANEIRGARIDATGAYNKKKEELDKRLDAMWKVVEAYRKEHAKEALPEQGDEFAFVANEARKVLNAGKNMKVLPAVEKMVEDAENLANDLGSMGLINGEVKKAIASAKKIVGKRHGKKDTVRVNAWQALDTEVTTFEKEWPSKRPATARSEAADLVVRCGEEEKREAAQHVWIDGQRNRINEARKLLADVETALKEQIKAQGEKFQGYDGALKKELDDAESFLTKEAVSWREPTEKKIGNAQVAITEMLKRLKGGSVESMQALKELTEEYKESIAAKDEETLALSKLQQSAAGWKEVSKAQYKNSKSAKSHKDDYEGLMKQVSSFLSDLKKDVKAKDPSKRSMDSASAEKRYRGYQQRMETILKDPPKIDHKSLAKMNEIWKAALGRLDENRGTLVRTISNDFVGKLEDGEEKKNYTQGIKDFDAKVKELLGTFDTEAFKTPAQVLGSDTSIDRDRLRQREVALNMVRLNRDRITANPLMKACILNPFNVPGFASPAYRALNQIDLEVQRGV